MASLDPSQFFCPFCGETIAKTAKLCRFCKHSVTKDLFLLNMPEDTRRGEITKMLIEKGPKELFPSFGVTRKKLENKQAFLKDVRQEDLEKIIPIFEKFQIQVDQRNHASTLENKPSFPWKPVVAAVIASLAVAGGYQYYKKNKMKGDSPSIAISATTSSTETTSENLKQQPKDPLLDQQRREDHANIEALLISTATVYAGNSSGSAFFVSHDGYLISNQHVTTTLKEVGILTFDGKKYRGTVVKSDSFYDLSLIKIETGDYPPLKLGDATKLHPGDTVWTVGAPHGLSFSVTRGVASYVGRNVGGKAFVQADVAINPGNSGGPMINDSGEVIGINNFIIKQTVGLNFAIPVNYLYMGMSPILSKVANTQPDNTIMATWRSWEQGASPVQMVNDDTQGSEGGSSGVESSNVDEINKLAKNVARLDSDFKETQDKNQQRATSLQHDIDDLTKKYGNSAGISEQEKIGAQLKKLRLDLVNLEIGNFDTYLIYNKSVADIIQRVKQLASNDARAVQKYEDQINSLSKAKAENEIQRAAKVNEKQALQNQQF